MTLNRTLIATLLAASFSFVSTGAFAIAIVNAGFEDGDTLADGDFRYEVPNGWTAYDPEEQYCPCPGDSGINTPWYNLGTINPNGTYSGAPEGSNVGFVYIGEGDDAGFDDDYPLGLQQTLSASLQANSRYDLSVAVGNAITFGDSEKFDGFGGYRIELLAGDTVIAMDETTASPEDGEFKIASLFLVTGDLVAGNSIVVGSDLILASALLGIRLIHRNDYAEIVDDELVLGWASEIAFDDVQLTVSAVPVPAAVWLFGSALVGLVGFSKRRKAA